MTEQPGTRSAEQRLRDVRHRLDTDVDLWVASADAAGESYLVPLSFSWDGERLLVSTEASSRTARNLSRGARTRVALGELRDVVMVDVEVSAAGGAGPDDAIADAFVARTGFDPRRLDAAYSWFWLRPLRVQAWRESDELADRELMRDGVWLES